MLQKNWMELIKPNKMDVNVQETNGRQGVLIAEPLERGFGLTLGNSLRRILLSSLQGAAITSIKVKGVVHEFSTIPGVKEDLTDIVLNLKSVGIKVHSPGARKMYLKAKGPGSGRETALRALQARGFKIITIKDTTPMPHNGTRPPKKRRV